MHESRFHSTVLIDDVGQVDAVSKNMTTPGRMVDVHDGPDLSYACGDAKYAYDWTWDGAGPWLNADGTLTDGEPGVEPAKLAKGWSKVMETPNDFMVEKAALHIHGPAVLPAAPLARARQARHRIKKPFNPVQKAFRTAALIRGKYPYALVIDDIQKDAESMTTNG